MSDYVLAIDPGDVQSAYVVYETRTRRPTERSIVGNDAMRAYIEATAMRTDAVAIANDPMRKDFRDVVMVIEFTPPYTMQTKSGGSFVPRQVVDTAIEIGRMIEAWEQHADSNRWSLLSRLDIKKHLLGRSNGDDSMVSAALFERFGGSRERAVGGTLCKTCHGKGMKGRLRATCPECEGGKQVQGARGLKLCPTCKAKGDVDDGPAKCPACRGSTWHVPPGPLLGFSADMYAALAVAVTFTEKQELAQAM